MRSTKRYCGSGLARESTRSVPPVRITAPRWRAVVRSVPHPPAEGSSTGLGLPQVHGVVRRAGGFVNVESALGTSTTITITIASARLQPHAAGQGWSDQFSLVTAALPREPTSQTWQREWYVGTNLQRPLWRDQKRAATVSKWSAGVVLAQHSPPLPATPRVTTVAVLAVHAVCSIGACR